MTEQNQHQFPDFSPTSEPSDQEGLSPYELPELLDQARDEQHLSILVAEHTARRRFEDVTSMEDASDEAYRSAQQRLQDMKDVRIHYELEHGYLEIPGEDT